jgi:cell division protein FtsL
MKIFQKKNTKRMKSSVRTPTAEESNFRYYQSRAHDIKRVRRDTSPQSKNVKRTRRQVLRHVPALLLCVIVFVSIVYVSTVDVNAKIVILNGDLKDPTVALRDDVVYQQSVQNYLSQSIVNRSKFLVDVSGLSHHLRKEFPELAAVSVTIPITGRRPVIELQTTKPAFVLATDKSSMLIGNNGVALIDVKDVKNDGRLSIRTVNDESGLVLTAGKAALPEEQAQFISIVIEQLEKQDFTVDVVTIPRSVYDLHIRLRGKPYYVKFNVKEDPLQQVGTFVAAARQVDDDIKEYIDVRIGERVFYR